MQIVALKYMFLVQNRLPLMILNLSIKELYNPTTYEKLGGLSDKEFQITLVIDLFLAEAVMQS